MPITKMDTRGRVQLPIGMRYKLDLNNGDEFAIDHLGDGTIILKKIGSQMSVKAMGSAGNTCSDILDFKPEGRKA